MNDSKYYSLTHSITEETQLLAEEKWIIEALNKIKTQRNCLQIERLQLESMKNQLQNPSTNSNPVKKIPESPKTPSTFALAMMQNDSEPKPAVPSTPKRKFLEREASCNTEQLNLGVTDSVFSINPSETFMMEEDDEEDEELNCEDLHLDMNMFMNCTQQQ